MMDKIPVIGTIRRRMRLELAPRAVVKGPAGETKLYRYKDPETGVIYVGKSRWDPFLIKSVLNDVGIDVKTDREI